jgi:hypothetical protein
VLKWDRVDAGALLTAEYERLIDERAQPIGTHNRALSWACLANAGESSGGAGRTPSRRKDRHRADSMISYAPP